MTGQQATVYRNDITKVLENRPSYYVPEAVHTFPMTLAELGYYLTYNNYSPNVDISNNFKGFDRISHDPPAAHGRNKVLESAPGLDLEFEVHERTYNFLDFLVKAPADLPFFAVNWIVDPHAPYHPHGRFKKSVRYHAGKLPKPLDYYLERTNYHLFDAGKDVTLDEYEREFVMQLYHAEVASVDERVGFILDVLEDEGLGDNTIIIFTSDHGEAFDEHGHWEHGSTYYEELMRVPMIIAGPGITEGHVVETPVSILDIAPTLQEWLGVRSYDYWHGASLAPALEGGEPDPRPLYLDAVYNPRERDYRDALVDGHFKLIAHDRPDTLELYDLASDPAERHNLADEQPDRVADMLNTLLQFRLKYAEEYARILPLSEGTGANQAVSEREKVLRRLRSLGYVK